MGVVAVGVQATGRLRGLPGVPCDRAARIEQLPNSGASLRCPAVTRTDGGRPPSQERRTLVEKPLLPRPSASSGEFRSSLFVASAPGVRRPRGGAPSPWSSPRSPPTRPPRPHWTRPAPAGAGSVAPPPCEAVVAGLLRAVPLGQVAPGRAGPRLPQDAVGGLAVVPPLLAAPAVLGQKRRDPLPSPIRQLPPPDHRLVPPLLRDRPKRRLVAGAESIHQTGPSCQPFLRSPLPSKPSR